MSVAFHNVTGGMYPVVSRIMSAAKTAAIAAAFGVFLLDPGAGLVLLTMAVRSVVED